MARAAPVLERRKAYDPTGSPDDLVLRQIRTHLEARLRRHLTEGMEVLDAGCGSQPFRSLVESLGGRYRSLDYQQNAEGTVEVVGDLGGELPAALKDKRFPLVLCTEVLEHIPDWERAFRNLASLTSPGGVLLVTCPNFYPLHEEPADFWRPTRYAFRHQAGRAGFVVEEEVAAGSPWDVLGLLLGHTVLASPPGPLKALLRKGLTLVKTLVYRGIRSGWLPRLVSLQGPFFLTHVVVLRRAGS